jgi:hypothetical protein
MWELFLADADSQYSAFLQLAELLSYSVLRVQRNGECAVSYVVTKSKGQCRAVIIVREISGLTVDQMTLVVQWAM